MKRIIILAVLFIVMSLASYARKVIAEGKTNSAFGNYKIQTNDKSVIINGKEHKPLIITYENSDMEIRVAIDMDRKTKTYYVLSDSLSVQYVSHRHYFGVERLDKVVEKDGFTTSNATLNKFEYFHQKAITTGRGWRRDNTKLIAVCFPLLLSNPENLLASK